MSVPLVTVATLQKQFGLILRRRRQAAKLSQEKLAELAGLHRTFVSFLERGLRKPTIDTLKSLAVALKTSMVSLIEELEERDSRVAGS